MTITELAVIFCGALGAGCATRFIVRGIGQAMAAIVSAGNI